MPIKTAMVASKVMITANWAMMPSRISAAVSLPKTEAALSRMRLLVVDLTQMPRHCCFARGIVPSV